MFFTEEERSDAAVALAELIDDALEDAGIDPPVSDDWADVIARAVIEAGWRPTNG